MKKYHVECISDYSKLQSTLDYRAGLGWRLVTVTTLSYQLERYSGGCWQLFFEQDA